MESFFVCWDLVRSISLAKDQKIQSDFGVGERLFPGGSYRPREEAKSVSINKQDQRTHEDNHKATSTTTLLKTVYIFIAWRLAGERRRGVRGSSLVAERLTD